MNDFLINERLPVTTFSEMLTFRDSNKPLELDGDLLETITNYDLNVSHSNPKHQTLIYESGKDMSFNIRQKGRKSNRDKSLINLLKSPAVMASGVSKTKFLSSDPDELCNRLKLILQEKQAGKILIKLIEKLLL